MPKRYFLDKSGAQTTRMQGRPGAGHFDIAKEVLTKHGITATERKDYYAQMFQLRFVRVVEHDDGKVEAEHGPSLTQAQHRFLDGLQRDGKTVEVRKTSI